MSVKEMDAVKATETTVTNEYKKMTELLEKGK